MVKKLILLFPSRNGWKLLCSTLIFGGFLFLLPRVGYAWEWLALFAAALFGIYLSLFPERNRFLVSFVFFPVTSVFLLSRLGEVMEPSHPLFLGSTAALMFLFFAFLGVIQFSFRDRFLWYGFVNAALLFFVFLAAEFFRFGSLIGSFVRIVVLFLAIALLVREALLFFDISARKRVLSSSAAISFAGVELSFLIGFLPLTSISEAAFLGLFALLTRDSVAAYLQGDFDRRFLLRELVFFFLVGTFIFLGTQWHI